MPIGKHVVHRHDATQRIVAIDNLQTAHKIHRRLRAGVIRQSEIVQCDRKRELLRALIFNGKFGGTCPESQMQRTVLAE